MDEAILRELYLVQKRSYKEIATELNISSSSVWRWIKKYNLSAERSKVEDLTGQEFGSLEVQEYVRSGRYKTGGVFHVWKCLCKKCKGMVNVRSGNLKQGQQTCKTCVAEIVKNKLRQCPIDYNIWFRMVERCRRKSIELSITPEYLVQLYDEQTGKCALTGEPIYFGETRKQASTASPDRIDCTKGYVAGNIRWVHKFINSMRHDMDTDEFVDWCRKVTDHAARNRSPTPKR